MICITTLLPASAMMTLGSPRRLSSLTHDLAPLNDSALVMSYTTMAAAAPLQNISGKSYTESRAERCSGSVVI